MKIRLALMVFVLSAPCAVAQGCLPPEQPYPYEPPTDDPELREIVRDQYQIYIEEAEGYMNCLQSEIGRAQTETREVLNRWVQYFGPEARMRYDEDDMAFR
ncbi:hypothetical protein CDV52_15845 [Haematobacter missouriensis]|nr:MULTISPECIES: hypothetical protein [Haematobacter]OWJ69481.1 hypothetical protein CDV50_17755 [Haematobacter massiliensis]OWJ72288.1 hypothetical protein CDV53_17620 [Haematobacter missouriensis]OWJ82017.1 hypothetical protein CDV52_15845 [Haematobacter missouriensis]OWJ82212.1 hypothetical protein CDV51_18085 [Haematobacter massiliensis]